ncbi:Patellin-6 [Sesamum alatum]|uniref:Patellin-6 n=1 Tax=Sesamum alatum TaxID=300844 RepID=A0AAE1YLY4_9LAMI|nr:Patellin-6 [Sesamum alatum]
MNDDDDDLYLYKYTALISTPSSSHSPNTHSISKWKLLLQYPPNLIMQDNQTPGSSPSKKSFVTSLMEAASLRTPSFKDHFPPQDLPEKSTQRQPHLHSLHLGNPIRRRKCRPTRDFRVQDSLNMLLKCLAWRKHFGADAILEEDLGFKELEGRVAYMHGFDREGHPVCYNAYGVFKDKEMYDKIFGDEEKLNKLLRWRVQVLERGIKLLQFKAGGVNSIIQVTDLN